MQIMLCAQMCHTAKCPIVFEVEKIASFKTEDNYGCPEFRKALLFDLRSHDQLDLLMLQVHRETILQPFDHAAVLMDPALVDDLVNSRLENNWRSPQTVNVLYDVYAWCYDHADVTTTISNLEVGQFSLRQWARHADNHRFRLGLRYVGLHVLAHIVDTVAREISVTAAALAKPAMDASGDTWAEYQTNRSVILSNAIDAAIAADKCTISIGKLPSTSQHTITVSKTMMLDFCAMHVLNDEKSKEGKQSWWVTYGVIGRAHNKRMPREQGGRYYGQRFIMTDVGKLVPHGEKYLPLLALPEQDLPQLIQEQKPPSPLRFAEMPLQSVELRMSMGEMVQANEDVEGFVVTDLLTEPPDSFAEP
jgi:hypothetical protein